MEKAPDAYRTISEVAADLDLPQHVLRFWETRFAQIKPLKRGGGRRYYRPDDIDLLKGIRLLLYGEGYTIRGVQRIIKDSGVKAVQALGRGEGDAPPQKPAGPDVVREAPTVTRPPPRELAPTSAAPVAFAPTPVAVAPVAPPPAIAPAATQSPVVAPPAAPFMPPRAAPPVQAAPVPPPARPEPARDAPPIVVAERPPAERPSTERQGDGRRLSVDDIRKLQATLYELGEIRRQLDDVFKAGGEA